MKIALITIVVLLSIQSAFCSFFINHSFTYLSSTDSDEVDDYVHTRMDNFLFIGASLNKKKTLLLGQSVHYWNKSSQTASSDANTIALLELGPRVLFYFTEMRKWYISGAYHPYTKGTRTLSGESQEVSGSSYLASFGYQIKLAKTFAIGASIHYHGVTIDKSIVEDTKEDVSHSYTTIIPMLDLSFRFR